MTVLSTGRVLLRPVNPSDYAFLYELECGHKDSQTYRHRGLTPSPEAFTASLWNGVAVSMIAFDQETSSPYGNLTLFDVDFRNAHGHIAMSLLPGARGMGWPLRAVHLFVDYVFDTFPLRKLYGEVLAPNLAQFEHALSRGMTLEGRLVEHEYVGGTFVDKVIVAVWKDRYRRHDQSIPLSLIERIRRLEATGT